MASPMQPDLAHQRHDQIERCWLCGIALTTTQLVPDGGSGCADVRWYCRDLRACTRRWTSTARPPAPATPPPAPPGHRPPATGPGNAATSTRIPLT
jgi:hypothetical protein